MTAANAIKTISVIGAGQMGTGIAQVAAHVAKVAVRVCDRAQTPLTQSKAATEKWFSSQVSKGRFTEAVAVESMERISYHMDMKDAVADADFIIEAASEDVEVKKRILKLADEIAPPHAVLASNTSSISISALGSATNRPQQTIGMHFMNPVPVMKLVELIRGVATSDETMKTTNDLADLMQKETTESKDVPGFIANRLLMPYINEAIFVLSEGVASKKHIDTTMTLGTNVPMGPLRLADFIGLDTCYAIMQVLHREFGDSKYRPCPLLANYVAAGWYGKKVGKGFYEYQPDRKRGEK